MKKMTFVISILCFGLELQAGDKVNNGGGIWTCSLAGRIEKAVLVDLYEQIEFNLTRMTTFEVDPAKIVDDRIRFVQSGIPGYSAKWTSYIELILKKIRFVDAELVTIDDAKPVLRPKKADCGGIDWEYTQFANYRNEQVLIREDIWKHPRVGALDKAALIWHEAIYKWLRDDYGDQDSTRARRIVGLLFSTETPQAMNTTLSEILRSTPKPPVDPPLTFSWICQIHNPNTSKFFSDYGMNQTQAKAKTLQICQQAEKGFFCDEKSIRCELIQQSEVKYSCTNMNVHTDRIYLGGGRSLLEAEVNARKGCQEGEKPFFCNEEVICE